MIRYCRLALVILPCLLIRIYQLFISPLLGPHCRFNPSCSSYALQALKTHGLFRGSFLSLNRIRKCHPWHEGGDDPVPGTQTENTRSN